MDEPCWLTEPLYAELDEFITRYTSSFGPPCDDDCSREFATHEAWLKLIFVDPADMPDDPRKRAAWCKSVMRNRAVDWLREHSRNRNTDTL